MKKAILYAFRHSLPIFISFIPVGLAYGILMQNAGFDFLFTGACSLFVFAGSLQYLMVSFFTGTVSLVTVVIMTLLLNSRIMFYGLSFVEKFRSFGKWRPLLVHTLVDETYSLHCAHNIPADVSEKQAYVFTAVFVWMYWVVLSVLGALIGSVLPFDLTGIDFALTALFVVIFIEQLKGAKSPLPAVFAVFSAAVCLLIFGADSFLLPSLMITVMLLIAFRGKIEPPGAEAAQRNGKILLIFAICFVCTELLRALPFLLFRGRKMPPVLQYVGRILPLSVMAIMVIYCLRSMTFTAPSGFLPHFFAVSVTAGLHLWKRNTLLSIFGGTACFMLLVQLVF